MNLEKGSKKEFEKIEFGSHQCLLYESRKKQLSVILSFIEKGIEENNKFLFLVDGGKDEKIKEGFEDSDTEIEKLIDSGQFEFITKKEVFPNEGIYDFDEMINFLRNAEEEALEKGYQGLRVVIDMNWLFKDQLRSERLIEYETKIKDFIGTSKTIILCQYDERRLKPRVLLDVIKSHSHLFLSGSLHENPYFMLSEMFDVRIKGEEGRKHYERIKQAIIERSKLKEERYRNKKRLEESEERYRRLFETAQDGMLILNADTGNIKDANPFIQNILGYSKEELVNRELWELGTFKNIAENKERFKELVDEGYIRYEDMPLKTKEGKEVPVEFVSNTYEAGGEKVLQCNIREISDRKQAEEALEHLTKSISRVAGVELYNAVVDELYEWFDVDGAFVGKIEDDGKTVSSLSMKLDGNKVDNYMYPLSESPCEFVTKDGPRIYRKNVRKEFPKDEKLKKLGAEGYLGFPIRDEDGETIGLIWVISKSEIRNLPSNWRELLEVLASRVSVEIEREETEQDLKDSLREKEVLLKEIHHRVKNNIQMISSMLNLQSRNTDDKTIQKAFNEIQGRIRAMALIHNILYQSEDVSEIDLSTYVDKLTRNLLKSLEIKRKKVLLKTEVKNISLTINQGVPCGLIINELVSNSLEHAFPEDFKGNAEVEVVGELLEDDEKVRIVVRDNGVGLPDEEVLAKSKTLGLHLVDILAEDQLNGSVEKNREVGSEIQITFKKT